MCKVIIVIFPLFFSLYMMLSQWNPGTVGIQFVGLKNIKAVMHDARFFHSLWLTFMYVAMLLSAEVTIGIIIAMLLQKDLKGKNFFRITYMLPMLLAPVAVSYGWKMLYDYLRGPFNYFLSLMGFKPVEWLTGKFTPVLSLVIVDI